MRAIESRAEQSPTLGSRGHVRAIQLLGCAVATGLGAVIADNHGGSWAVVTTLYAAGLVLSVASFTFALAAAVERRTRTSASKRV